MGTWRRRVASSKHHKPSCKIAGTLYPINAIPITDIVHKYISVQIWTALRPWYISIKHVVREVFWLLTLTTQPSIHSTPKYTSHQSADSRGVLLFRYLPAHDS